MSHSATVIAIVDDEEPVRKALGRLLRAAGFDPRAFASGRDFLDSLGLQLPDCAIVDLHLPGLSGLEVQNQLSQANIHLPCIIITGKDEPGTSDAVKAAGAAAYLSKPLDEQVLLGAISSAMPQDKQISVNHRSGHWPRLPANYNAANVIRNAKNL